jgi:GGDEF domain-containing protein
MLITPRPYPLLIVDPMGTTTSRAAQGALERLPCRVVKADASTLLEALAAYEPAVALLVSEGGREVEQLSTILRDSSLELRPTIALLSKTQLDAQQQQNLGIRLQFVPPFDWQEVTRQLEQVLTMECLQRSQQELDSLLQLGHIALISIDVASQQCVTSPLARSLLGLDGSNHSRASAQAAQRNGWQALFACCDEQSRYGVVDLIMEALNEGAGFEVECDVQLDRTHRRRIRLTGRRLAENEHLPHSVDIVLQDITPQTGRSAADAVNRMLDTTLGLGRRDRVLQSLIRAVNAQNNGSVLLIRLQGLAELYRRHGYQDGGTLLRDFAAALEDSIREDPSLFRIDTRKNQAVARLTGGEFVAFAPGLVDDRNLAGLITRLFGAADRVLRGNDKLSPVNLKCGIASWPRDGASPDELLSAAHQASQYFEPVETGQAAPGMMSSVVRARAVAAALPAQGADVRWQCRWLRSPVALATWQ